MRAFGMVAAWILPVVLTVLAGSIHAEDVRSVRVQFPKGQSGATLSDIITGFESVEYRLSARSGQLMTLSLTASNDATYFNVYQPDRGPGDAAIARSDVTGPTVPAPNRARLTLPASGDYRISVYLVRAAARRGERSRFTLEVAITDGAVTQLPTTPGEAPTGGEPRFWRVAGLAPGDQLNVRSGPSTAERVIDRLAEGQVVRNRGCSVSAGGSRWCRVHRVGQAGNSGWASARYLIATQEPSGGVATQLPGTTGGVSVTQLPGDAAVPGTSYSATGSIACTMRGGPTSRICSYGVIRRGGGSGTLVVTMRNGGERTIEFEAGRPVWSNAPGEVHGQWSGDTVIVTLGTNEIYRVPNAVLFGG